MFSGDLAYVHGKMSDGRLAKERRGGDGGRCETCMCSFFLRSGVRSSYGASEMVYIRIREKRAKLGDKKRCVGIRG